MVRNPVDRYLTTQVQSCTRGEVVLLLYDAAIRCISRAELALEERRLDLANARLVWTQNIMLELVSRLDLERGGDLAGKLGDLYLYMYRTLLQANLHKDADSANGVKHLLELLRAAWRTSLSLDAQSRGEYRVREGVAG